MTLTENRLRVAYEVANLLSEHLGTVDLAVLAAAGDDEWARILELAGRTDGYVPSRATRSTVLGILREKQAGGS